MNSEHTEELKAKMRTISLQLRDLGAEVASTCVWNAWIEISNLRTLTSQLRDERNTEMFSKLAKESIIKSLCEQREVSNTQTIALKAEVTRLEANEAALTRPWKEKIFALEQKLKAERLFDIDAMIHCGRLLERFESYKVQYGQLSEDQFRTYDAARRRISEAYAARRGEVT